MKTLKLYATHGAALTALREYRNEFLIANLSRMSLTDDAGNETFYRKVPETEFERMWYRGMTFNRLEWNCDLAKVPGDVVTDLQLQVREVAAA
jgi:hypothetical protein